MIILVYYIGNEKKPNIKEFLWVIDHHNNGNFICVFECSIVNLATYKCCLRLDYSKKRRKEKKRNQNCIKSGLSQLLFLQQKM